MQALQRICQFPANLPIIQLPCTSLGDYVVTGSRELRFVEPVEFPYQTPDPVPADRIPHFTADCDPYFCRLCRTRPQYDKMGSVDLLSLLGNFQVLGPLQQSFFFWKNVPSVI